MKNKSERELIRNKLERELTRELRHALLDLEDIEDILLRQQMKVIIKTIAHKYREIFLDAIKWEMRNKQIL